MGALIVHRQLTIDRWQWLDASESPLPHAAIVVPLARLRSEHDALSARPGDLGVLLQPDEDPLELSQLLGRLTLIAVNFPSFTDGRGYSIARLLCDRLGWKGELRAVGDIQRDQVFYLSRVGFNAFSLKDGQDPEDALRAFNDFSAAYQASVAQPEQRLRRRAPQ